jgi:DNA polymerase elongation subunit (family B)
MNRHELEKELEAINVELELALKEYNYNNAMQLAYKLILNGSYGAFANPYFACTNMAIAGGITSMGRHIIQYMDICNEKYWYEKFHLDYELHEILGVKNVQKIPDTYIMKSTGEYVENPTEDQLNPPNDKEMSNLVTRTHPVSIYVDTDSLFVGFEPGLIACGWEGDPMDFIMKMYEHRLYKYFNEMLEGYAADFKVKNLQDFELERINESIIFLGKKRYVQHALWEDKVHYKRLSYLYPKGVELVKSSTPPFARTRVKKIIEYLFENPADYNIKDLLKMVKDLKQQFELADIDDISMTTSCNNYAKHVVNDTTEFEYASGCPSGVKAAAFHNYILNQSPEYKDKYGLIGTGSRIKYYYCKHEKNEMFGYLRGNHPREIAPEVDMDVQFEKAVLNVVNTFVVGLGMPTITKRLRVVMALFSF